MEKLIIVGTGELSNDIRFFVERYDLYRVIGYAVNKEYIKSDIHKGLPVYQLEKLNECVNPEEVKVFISISWFHYLNREREKVYNLLKAQGFSFANLISPQATVLTDKIGEGNWICDFVYLDFETEIGSNNVIRNYAYLGHYVTIGNHNFLGAKSLIGGNSRIGNRVFIGVAATVFNDVKIGNRCIVGGAAVAKNSMNDFTLCKVSNESVFIKEYTDDTIDLKLAPGFKRKNDERKS